MLAPWLLKHLLKVLPTKKSLVVSFWTLFQISLQPRRIRKNRNHQEFLLMQGYLSKVYLENSSSHLITVPQPGDSEGTFSIF